MVPACRSVRRGLLHRKESIFMKRLLALLLLSACLPVCFACGEADPVSGGETENKPGDVIPIVWDGETEYQVLRSDTCSKEISGLCTELIHGIEDKTGVKPPIRSDWDDKDRSDCEILVGSCKREAAAAAFAELKKDEYLIRTEGNTVILVGGSDETTALAVKHFLSEYVAKGEAGKLTVPKGINMKTNIIESQLNADVKGSPLKKMFSDYDVKWTDTPLISFDYDEISGHSMSSNGEWSLDRDHKKEGKAALRYTLKKDMTKELDMTLWQKKSVDQEFTFSVEDRKKTTLVLWLYIDDIDKMVCDHDAGYGRQTGQGTFFFRVLDNKGRVYCWNHTIMGSGWHEIELNFNIHNGADENFDYHNITSFGLLFSAKEGTVIELDDLRGRVYESDYVSPAAPHNGRLITTGEYDAFDGCVVQEWYGAEFDTEDKMEGKSSFKCTGNNSNADFRSIVANLDLPMDYENDVLVINAKVDDLTKISSLFIELNEVQDVHEYEKSFSLTELKQYGLTGSGKWCELRIPLSAFSKNLQSGKTAVTLHNFRYVMSASGEKNYVSRIDLVYLTTKAELGIE